MAVDTARVQLGWFVDAAVEMLPARDLRMTPLTRYSWKGVDRELADRCLWELEDHDCAEVAQIVGVQLDFVEALARLANGRR